MSERRMSRYVRVVALAVVFVLVASSVALAAVRIYENYGVGRARLGQTDRTAKARLGRVTRSGVNRNYRGQTVYYFYFGRRMRNGKYPLEMYSKRPSRRVFAFVANSSSYVTRKGIKVGSSVTSLRRAYGSKLRRSGSAYIMGPRSGQTVFYTRSGRVRQICVWRY